MQACLTKAKVIHDQLLAMGVTLSSGQLATLILMKLPLDYRVISQALQCRVIKNKLNFDDLDSLLLEEESILITQGS